MENIQLTTACSSCGALSKSTARFCSECGKHLGESAPQLSVQAIGLILVTAAALWAAGWATQRSLLGNKPTQAFTSSANGTSADEGGSDMGPEQAGTTSDPEIEKLTKEAEASAKDPAKLLTIAGDLVKRYHQIENPSRLMALGLIDTFSSILASDPKNSSALLGMAEVSFDQQAFPKAVEFYERYLGILPGDVQVHQRYAASLTFVGRYKESIAQLEKILKKDPKNFSANAYLTIAYAEDSQLDKALEIGNKTMALAPSDEARERFGAFMSQLKHKIKGAAPDESNIRGNMPAKDNQAEASSAATADWVGPIEAAIKQSPIAAPKFVRSEIKPGGVLALYFKGFPMEQMPPFAKEKFLSRIREAGSKAGNIKTLSFIDASSGKEMDTVALGSDK